MSITARAIQTGRNLNNLRFMYFCILYVRNKLNVLCVKLSDILAYFHALDTFIEIRRAVT